MIATSYVDRKKRADGSIYEKKGVRYICCNNTRSRGECDGQGSYIAEKIEKTVEEVVIAYLKKIKLFPRDVALERRYKSEIISLKEKQSALKKSKQVQENQLNQLTDEIANSLIGNSTFTPEILSNAINKG